MVGIASQNENSVGGAPVGAEQHGADDGRAGTRHARHHGQALHHADAEIHRQRELRRLVDSAA